MTETLTETTWFVKRETRKHEIALPDAKYRAKRIQELRDNGANDAAIVSAHAQLTAEVELRPLTAGDVAQLNELKLRSDGASIDLGQAKILAVELALVGWSLDQPITTDTIKQLNPLVFEQIYELVDGGEGANGSGPPQPAAQEPPVTPKDAADSS